MRTRGTRFHAKRSGESCRTVAFPGDVIALATVRTLAYLGTVLSEAIAGTRFLAVATLVSALAVATSVGCIADRVIRALALLGAIRAPSIRWTFRIATLSGVSFIAPADIGLDALAIPTAGLTLRRAMILILAEGVTDAALLHDALLDDGARFVHCSDLDSVRGAAGRYSEAPLLVPLLVSFIPWCRYRYGNILNLLAHVRALQMVILDDFGKRLRATVGAYRQQDRHRQHPAAKPIHWRFAPPWSRFRHAAVDSVNVQICTLHVRTL